MSQRRKGNMSKKSSNSLRTPVNTVVNSAQQSSTSKKLHETPSLPVSVLAPMPKTPETIPANSERTLIAYVHQLSVPIRNKKDTMDYAKLVLQTDDRNQEALLYSKAKRRILENSQTSRTPIKIQRFTYTGDTKKIIINDMTKVSMPDQKEYCFQYKDLQSSRPVTIEHIMSSCSEWEMVTFIGKAVHVAQTEITPSKKLKLAKATFADKTGTIQLDIWEQFIPMIKEGHIYQISPVQVRQWDQQIKLSTSFHSVVTEIQDESLTNLTVPQSQIKADDVPVEIQVPNICSVVQVETLIQCVNCFRRIIQATAAKIVQCDICHHAMRAENCKRQLCAKLLFKPSQGQPVTLTAFESSLSTVLKDISNF